MFVQEAQWIKDRLEEIDLEPGIRILDIGSSTKEFRTAVQPHIHRLLHKPLIDRGCRITWLDIKEGEGIDMVMDLTEPELSEAAFENKFEVIICCNILEHVANRKVFIKNVLKFCHTPCLLMLTVPRQYPKHKDPIDTMFRPSPRQLYKFVNTFEDVDLVKAATLSISDREYYSAEISRKLDFLSLRPVRMWLRWYIKPLRWKVTCLLLKIR